MTTYAIYPALGVARLGNSDEYYVGPEAPGHPPRGPFKDRFGRILKQAVRFRIYEHSSDGSVREITTEDANIEWTVRVANCKGIAPHGPEAQRMRNADVDDRSKLIIDSGTVILGQAGDTRDLKGNFLGQEVILGEVRLDEDGRLIALGGWGRSGSVPQGLPCDHPLHNDGWHDDVCDGLIRAAITLKGGQSHILAQPARLLVAPPDFAPGIQAMVTLYDLVLDMFDPEPPLLPSFTDDVYPILKRVADLALVSHEVQKGHGPGTGGDFLEASRLERLATRSGDYAVEKAKILSRVTPPGQRPNSIQAMPKLRPTRDPSNPMEYKAFTLTSRQYAILERWANGMFQADWTGRPKVWPAWEAIPETERPHALDRAMFESCIGGPFDPGLEASYLVSMLSTYQQPFRIREDLVPGSLTAELAVPWQADFESCGRRAWPSHRPTRTESPDRAPWIPHGFLTTSQWWQLDFIDSQLPVGTEPGHD